MVIGLGATVLARSPWLGPFLCLVTRFSDRFFTVRNARLDRAQSTLIHEGSFEINPHSQRDVDALRTFSASFVPMLLGPAVFALIVRFAVGESADLRGVYLLVLGFFLLCQLAIHYRHARTWYLFKAVTPFTSGKIETPKGASLRASVFEFVCFAALYLAIYAVTGSFFVLGGVLGCVTIAGIHYRIARRHPLVRLEA